VAVLNCPQCGTPWVPEDVYCRRCGQFATATVVAAPTPAVAEEGEGGHCRTPGCAQPLAPGETICGYCGEPVADLATCELLFPWGAHRLADGERLTLGRGVQPFAGPLAAYPNVGRTHARIAAGRGVLRVTDLKSQNGTFIDGVRLSANTPTDLRPGQLLRLAASLEIQIR
jgi:hypothetical protein